MRKDVKLGMAIGGGLIVLLVGYLLFAPPSNSNKKGTQFVGGGNGSIIDTAGPGDLSGGVDEKSGKVAEPTTPGAKTSDPKAVTAQGSPGTGAAGSGPGKIAEGSAVKGEEKPKTAGNDWNSALNKGKVNGPIVQATIKETDGAKPIRHETEGRGTPSTPEGSKLLYNPNDAWGGGVSTDAVFGSPRARSGGRALVTGATELGTGGGTHVVKAGETLSSIALSAYGSPNHYPAILRANPNVNPNNLKLGTVLKLPPADDVKTTAASEHAAIEHSAAQSTAALEVKIDPSRQYRVQQGDSLYKISMKVYGKSSYLDKIYEKNKAAIGSDNKRLKLGMVLDLPEKAPMVAAAPADPTTSTLGDAGTAEENQAK